MSGTADGRPGHRRLLGSLATGAAIVALAMTAGAAWDGQQTIVLGDSVSSAFQSEPGAEMHRYDFYAPTGTSLKAKIKVDGNLAPAWQVFTQAGEEVDLGTALKGTQIKNYKFEEGGHFYMKVTATSGAGRYAISFGGSKLPSTFKAKGATDEYGFEAVAGSSMSVKLKKGPTLTGLEGPFGPVAITEGVTSVKNFILPYSGHYVLAFDGTGDVDVKLKAPKSVSYFFDATETTRGVADLARGEWLTSGHADFLAEPFRHWDEDGEVSTSCAACHSSYGFQDFVGADGTPSNVLGSPSNTTDNPAALGSTVDCNACHNTATPGLSVVQFPSGAIVEGLGNEARCMQCHQGRESKNSVDANIQAAADAFGPGWTDDTESSTLRFRNIHYFAAGASLMGADAHGAYEFEGKTYNHKFPHVASTDACQKCHNQHTLEIRYERCAECHEEGASPTLHNTPDWVYDIRFLGSFADYDGNNDSDEGIYYELQGLSVRLYAAMQAYANDRGNPIVYNADSYPYWYNADGTSYNHWTARLVRAAYNYQYYQKDPGLFAHNGKYGIEFLYDTIESFYEANPAFAPGFNNLVRNDSGHFDNTSEAFRHWDNTGIVQSSCAKCHSPGGFAFSARYGIAPIEGYPAGDGFACEQCHEPDAFTQPNAPRIYVDSVTFPSGVTIDNDPDTPDDSFLCMTCHQGRESKATVDDDIAAGKWSFNNIHYLAAGPSLYGADAAVGYEYDDASAIGAQTYVGKWGHFSAPNGGMGEDSQCAFCHLSDHTFLPKSGPAPEITSCGCHGNPADIESIRTNRGTDYNGNGNANEKLKDEVQTFGDRLLLAMQDYTVRTGKPMIVYNPDQYPYFLKETGGSYTDWDAPLMKASFNFQFWAKEPGAWAHNTHYVLQLLFDSINDLQTAVAITGDDHLTTPTTLTRPGNY